MVIDIRMFEWASARGSYHADYQGVAHSSCSPFAAGGIRKMLRVKELAATVHRDRKVVV